MDYKNITKKELIGKLKKMRRLVSKLEKPRIDFKFVENSQPEFTDKYLTILQELPDMVYKIDPDGYFTFVNNSIRSLGYEPEELVGKHFSKIIHPDDVEAFSRYYVLPRYKGKVTGDKDAPKLFDERRTGERKTKDLEIRLISKKQTGKKEKIGKVIAFGDISSVGHYDATETQKPKKFLGTLGIIRDITEHKQIEDALKRSEKYFHTLTENASDIIIIVDKKGTITYVSPSLERLSGYKREELIGKSGFDFIVPADLPRAIYDFGKAILTKEVIIPNSFRVRHKNGSERILEGVGKNLLDNPIIAGFVMNVRDVTERIRAEEQLIRLSNAVKMSTDSIVISDLKAKIIDVNEATLRMYKTNDKRDLIGKNSIDIIAPEDRKRAFTGLKTVMRKGYITNQQYNIITRDGGILPVEMSTSIMKNSDGKPVGFVAITKDIAERKKAEDALRMERQRLHDVLETMPMMVCLLTPDYHIPFANRAFRTKFGESRGRHCYEYCFGKKEPCDFCEAYQVLKTGKPHHWEVTTPDGSTIIDVYDFPFTDVDGSPKILEVDIDITERRRMEAKLHYQADMLQHVTDAIISTSLNFKIRTWNQAAESMYGYKAYEVIGKPLVRPGMEKLHFNWQTKLLKDLYKNGFWHGELRQKRKNGTSLDVLSTVTFMRDSSGKPIGFIVVDHDITERKNMENELHEAFNKLNKKQKELDELTKKIINAQEEERRYLAAIIHDEFLQGIVSILYFLGTIDVSFDKKFQKMKESLTETVKASIDKGRALISEIEPIREISTGLIVAVKKTIDSWFVDTGVRVRFIHPKAIPRLKKDTETNVFRIIQEALFNIHRHARAASVLVKISLNKNNLEVEISDDGVGFIPELVVKKKTGHYGLLSMQERAHLLGCDLTISSKPGKGTMIKFSFPFS